MAVIHALELCEPKERTLIETVLEDRSFDTVPYTKIQEILRKYCSVEAASARAMKYAEAACNAISDFPDSEIKRALLWAPEFVVARDK
jgi:octaprenyl-diphosphate synthase